MSLILPYAQAPIGGRPGQGIHGMRKRVRAVRLDGTAGTYISTADSPDYDVTDLDVRFGGAVDNWALAAIQTLVSKRGGAGQTSFQFRLNSGGRLALAWSANGTDTLSATSTLNPTATNRGLLLVRCTMDVDDGSGNRVLRFSQKSAAPRGVLDGLLDDSSWSLVGTAVTTVGTTAIFNSTAAVEIGGYNSGASDRLIGLAYGAVLKSAIDGTTLIAADCTKLSFGATAFTDRAGRVHTLNGTAHVQAA